MAASVPPQASRRRGRGRPGQRARRRGRRALARAGHPAGADAGLAAAVSGVILTRRGSPSRGRREPPRGPWTDAPPPTQPSMSRLGCTTARSPRAPSRWLGADDVRGERALAAARSPARRNDSARRARNFVSSQSIDSSPCSRQEAEALAGVMDSLHAPHPVGRERVHHGVDDGGGRPTVRDSATPPRRRDGASRE